MNLPIMSNEFYNYSSKLCVPQSADSSNEEYENMALEFLRQYENSNDSFLINGSAVKETANGNFIVEETECAIHTENKQTAGLYSS